MSLELARHTPSYYNHRVPHLLDDLTTTTLTQISLQTRHCYTNGYIVLYCMRPTMKCKRCTQLNFVKPTLSLCRNANNAAMPFPLITTTFYLSLFCPHLNVGSDLAIESSSASLPKALSLKPSAEFSRGTYTIRALTFFGLYCSAVIQLCCCHCKRRENCVK